MGLRQTRSLDIFPGSTVVFQKLKIHVAYTTDEAVRRIGDDIDVQNAIVVIDNLTNDVRGTRQRPAASPAQLVERVDRLRRRLQEAGAAYSVTCEVKPMEVCDVRMHNAALHEYLRSQQTTTTTAYGCRTQIRREFLQRDGFHIRPQFDSVIDRTYACAIFGINVPCPTPVKDFTPEFARRNFERDFPSLTGDDDRLDQRGGGRAPVTVHGWYW